MAYTYSKIATYTVGSSSVPSVSFLNIPQTYSDLVLKISCRLDSTGAGTGNKITFNSLTDSYSTRQVFGDGINARSVSGTFPSVGALNGTTETSNTFSVSETYISNYTAINYKSFTSEYASENNTGTSGAYLGGLVLLWSNSNPITSITLTPEAGNYVQYSTFHLYGIKAEI
jgi:hypothetical protein